MTASELKILVQKKYTAFAKSNDKSIEFSFCNCNTTLNDSFLNTNMELGDKTPVLFSEIKPNDHVLDLGSGTGTDCFVARTFTGKKGYVAGIDFTDAMLEKAHEKAQKLACNNVEFIKGNIEEMPFQGNKFNCIISNYTISLVPDKTKAFKEMYRVLTTGGRFCISDIVIKKPLPLSLIYNTEMYANGISGAMLYSKYLALLEKTGFKNIEIKDEKAITIPIEILQKHLSPKELTEYSTKKPEIYCMTIAGHK